jgi:hypothetical protein
MFHAALHSMTRNDNSVSELSQRDYTWRPLLWCLRVAGRAVRNGVDGLVD